MEEFNEISLEEILEALALFEGSESDEIESDMEKAILHAFLSGNANMRTIADGKVPTIEQVMAHLEEKLKD